VTNLALTGWGCYTTSARCSWSHLQWPHAASRPTSTTVSRVPSSGQRSHMWPTSSRLFSTPSDLSLLNPNAHVNYLRFNFHLYALIIFRLWLNHPVESATTGVSSEWYLLSHSDGAPPSPPFSKLLMVSVAFVRLDTGGKHL
jgi:hypothetical protein